MHYVVVVSISETIVSKRRDMDFFVKANRESVNCEDQGKPLTFHKNRAVKTTT